MSIHVTPEVGVPLPPDDDDLDFFLKAQAMAQTADVLKESGLDVEPDDADDEAAQSLLKSYAVNPTVVNKEATVERMSALTPAALQHLRAYLDEFGKNIVTQAVELRHFVTNRLLQESQNPDPRIRIKALELLGKHSDVGLFTERSEITVTHQSTDELREKLREKLQKLIKKDESQEVWVPAEEKPAE
jgi:hypothetical protein